MTDARTDPVVALRTRLQDLFVQVRRPTYRSLATHADHEGRTLRASTLSNLLNGPGTPRWDTVETFVRACIRYALAHRIKLAAKLLDLDRWHADYRDLENALSDQAARREQIAGRPVPTRRRRLAIPAQLPPDVSTFTGRDHHLAALHRLLSGHEDAGDAHREATAVVISAIDGTAGVGKTALAVHWAHQVRDRFPDGQLYVNLRGFDPSGQVMDPATAVRGFLDALEVPPQRIPTGPDAQAALYRSLLIDKHMLIVLDNARDTAQVRPLVPGAPGCLVLVTSRNQLHGLVAAHAAHPLTLDLLTTNEARHLLAHRLGNDRIAADPDAIDEIITQCARLPLALALVTAHAALRPHITLHTLADQLRDSQRRWHTLAGDDPATDLQAVFSWSYRALTPDAARLFRLLGLHPGPDITAPAAASLTILTPAQVRPLLAELTRANLLTEPTPGRYTLHDLLRAYATEQAEINDPETQRHAAINRLIDYHLHTAHAAARLLDPHRDPIPLAPAEPSVTPEIFAECGQAMAWLTTEYPVLLAVLRQAASAGFDVHTWQLAWTLARFQAGQGNWRDWVAAQEMALAAVQRTGDRRGQAEAHRLIACAHIAIGRYDDDAHDHLRRALELFDELGEHTGQACTHLNQAELRARQGRHIEALDHCQIALNLYQTAGHGGGQVNTLNLLGGFHGRLGNHQQALVLGQQALTPFQQMGDQAGEADTWIGLGYAHQRLGHHAEATACYRHARNLFHDLGYRYYEAWALAHLGDSHHAAGNPNAARNAWQAALTILDDLNHPSADQIRARLHHLDHPAEATEPDHKPGHTRSAATG